LEKRRVKAMLPLFTTNTMEKERDTIQDFYELSVNEIKDKRLPLIEKDASIDCVLSILTENDHVWVVESKGSKKLVGIITEHDILGFFSPRKEVSFFGLPSKKSLHYETFEKAGHIMSRAPIICSPDEKVKDALSKMVDHRVRRTPVVKNSEIIGEITLHHLIREFYTFIKNSS
jgi:predicted transcriptional regulator